MVSYYLNISIYNLGTYYKVDKYAFTYIDTAYLYNISRRKIQSSFHMIEFYYYKLGSLFSLVNGVV